MACSASVRQVAQSLHRFPQAPSRYLAQASRTRFSPAVRTSSMLFSMDALPTDERYAGVGTSSTRGHHSLETARSGIGCPSVHGG